MELKDIIGIRLDNTFISTLILNGIFVRKVLKDEKEVIEKATGNHYIHAFLYQLMLLKYPKLKVTRFNKKIVDVDLSYYKFFLEDKFMLYYISRNRLSDVLLSCKQINDYYRIIIINEKKKFRIGYIREMVGMKAFGNFNYFSFLGCIKLFFNQAKFTDALIFAIIFLILHLTPAFFLRFLYKCFIKIKYKEKWHDIWMHIVVVNSEMSKGSERLIR